MMFRQSILTLILMFAAFGATFAQDQGVPKSLNEVFKSWDLQMQRGIPQQQGDTVRLKPGQNEYFHYSPDSSSYFYMKIDTSMGNNMRQFFRFGDGLGDQPNGTAPLDSDPFFSNPFFSDPFGNGGGGMGGFEDIFKQMEEMQRQFFGLPPAATPTQLEQENDGLLPEERLRLEEEQKKAQPDKKIAPHPAPAKPKSKIKTTRI
jgi:hypothetical protein